MVFQSGAMMQAYMERIGRALWTFRQPLTRRPKSLGVPVSDLFVWRNDANWETSFELIDIPGLFEPDKGKADRHVTFIFLDKDGVPFLERRIDLGSCQRQTLELSSFIPESQGSYGTFCVFHSETPDVVASLGSYLAERGYVSYRYKKNPLRAYVHGNLDAVAMLPDRTLQQLGGSSILAREYRLQHELRGSACYEVGIVNPCPRNQRVSCRVVSARTGALLDQQHAHLGPCGCYVFSVQVEASQHGRIVIASHMIMGRPLLFRTQGQGMDVFHG